MSKNVEFHSYSVNVKTALKDKAIAFLHEIGGEIKSQAQRNSRRKTSQTAGSYQYKVDEDALAVHIGSDYWNAIYEEFGTGEHAINGGGRKGYWVFVDTGGNHKHQKVEDIHQGRSKKSCCYYEKEGTECLLYQW